MPFYLYILKSKKTDKFYIGHTNDLERRITEHNSGQTKSTKSGIPWEIVFKREFNSNTEANQAELKLKKMKSRKYIENFISDNS
jgi:putative endonuclease